VTAVSYTRVAGAIEATGMVARGGFVVGRDDVIPSGRDGHRTRSVVMVGNVGGAMWPRFRAEQRDEPDPLDAWTRRVLGPIADEFGAALVHPSDEPFQPIMRWAQRAADVWPSPIGLLVHPTDGLWHAYRGALLFAREVVDLPPVGVASSPCVTCDQPCLTTCPVDAFTDDGYDHESCRDHVRSDRDPDCLTEGCAARRACPVNADGYYDVDQMRFHMRAFLGDA